MEEALQKALAVVSPSEVAEACNIKVQAVYQWKVCPPGRVLTLEKLSGVTRHELRPDVFGSPEKAA